MTSFKLSIIVVLTVLFFGSCFRSGSQNTASNSNIPPQKKDSANQLEAGHNAAVNNDPAGLDSDLGKQKCLTTKMEGKNLVMKPQTFPIDFEPFSGSCFVTYYNREYPDPPVDSHYAIYKNDKKIFDFPEQFNGATFGCWVDGVAFQDLNSDDLRDVIVIGKCSAKGGSYNENVVYINTGKTFVTRPDGNNRLSDFTKIKEVADFVQDNQQVFFK